VKYLMECGFQGVVLVLMQTVRRHRYPEEAINRNVSKITYPNGGNQKIKHTRSSQASSLNPIGRPMIVANVLSKE